MSTEASRSQISLEGVSVSWLDESRRDTILFKCGNLTNKYDVTSSLVDIEVRNDTIFLSQRSNKRQAKALKKTLTTVFSNLCRGVREPFVWQLEFQYKHFVVRISREGDYLVFENIYGRKAAHTFRIPSEILDVRVQKVSNKLYLFLRSTSPEKIGNFFVRINNEVRSKGDRRVFGDRLYIISKNAVW